MATFYVSKGRKSWVVYEESYKDGERRQKALPREAYLGFGFAPSMTLEDARARARQLNALSKIEREKKVEQARRAIKSTVVNSAIFPPQLCDEFAQFLLENSFGGKQHQRRLMSHWYTIQEMMVEIEELEPPLYFKHANRIFRYFIDQPFSLDYCNKLLRVINLWGSFVCEKRGAFFRPVPKIAGLVRQRINDAYIDGDTYRGASEPITPELLDTLKSKLSVPGNYEWLYLSVWLGLRPAEIDSLFQSSNWQLTAKDGVDVLWVYQSKLVKVDKNKRWKPIPLLFKEQKKVLEIIKLRQFKRPLYKIMDKVFGERFTLYGGRKGFHKLMKDLGQQDIDISQWMGHKSLARTLGDYKDRMEVRFTKPKEGA